MPSIIHPKLVVGEVEVNDPLEHEVDRVADQVMRMSDPDHSAAVAPLELRRKCAACEEEGHTKLPAKTEETAGLSAKYKAIPSDKLLDLPSEPVPSEEGAQTSSAEAELPAGTTAEPASPVASAQDPNEGKTKAPVVEFAVVDSSAPDRAGLVKTKCTTPGKAATAFPVASSTAAQIGAMSACTWGITQPDPLIVTTNTCQDGGNWQLRVMGALSRVRTFSRQLPGQQEPTTANATAANFCTQVSELDALGKCSGSWYMLSAVRAHENVHVKEWKTSFPTDWPAQKAIIDGMTVPASGATKSAAAATKAMRGSAAFTNAIQTGQANYPTFWGIPDPNANTNAAERAVVDPRINQICRHAKAKGWTPSACPVCSALGIT